LRKLVFIVLCITILASVCMTTSAMSYYFANVPYIQHAEEIEFQPYRTWYESFDSINAYEAFNVQIVLFRAKSFEPRYYSDGGEAGFKYTVEVLEVYKSWKNKGKDVYSKYISDPVDLNLIDGFHVEDFNGISKGETTFTFPVNTSDISWFFSPYYTEKDGKVYYKFASGINPGFDRFFPFPVLDELFIGYVCPIYDDGEFLNKYSLLYSVPVKEIDSFEEYAECDSFNKYGHNDYEVREALLDRYYRGENTETADNSYVLPIVAALSLSALAAALLLRKKNKEMN